jgi:hypothetical protein
MCHFQFHLTPLKKDPPGFFINEIRSEEVLIRIEKTKVISEKNIEVINLFYIQKHDCFSLRQCRPSQNKQWLDCPKKSNKGGQKINRSKIFT